MANVVFSPLWQRVLTALGEDPSDYKARARARATLLGSPHVTAAEEPFSARS